jgi:hypothetical protein
MLLNNVHKIPCDQFCFSHRIELARFVIHVHADDDRVIQSIQAIVDEDLVNHDDAINEDRPRLCIRVLLSTRSDFGRVDLPPVDQATSTFQNLEYYDLNGTTVLAVDRTSVVAIHPVEGLAIGYISQEHAESPWTIAHRIFYLPMIEMLRFHKAYYIHAGCVCEGNKGILICGPSGQGKSTLTYALARSRFSYLSDDGVFLRRDDRSVEVFSFPERIKLDNRSCSHFEEFSHLCTIPGKWELRLKETRIRRVSRRAEPCALVFPSWGSDQRARIKAISKNEGLVRLVGQSICPTAPSTVHEHLEMLAHLVMMSDCYDLRTSENLDDAAELVAEAVLV